MATKTAPLTFALVTIKIRGEEYRVIPTVSENTLHRTWSLVKKKTGEVHTITEDDWGRVTCTCPDFVYRKADRYEDCKHIKALRHFGILSKRPY